MKVKEKRKKRNKKNNKEIHDSKDKLSAEIEIWRFTIYLKIISAVTTTFKLFFRFAKKKKKKRKKKNRKKRKEDLKAGTRRHTIQRMVICALFPPRWNFDPARVVELTMNRVLPPGPRSINTVRACVCACVHLLHAHRTVTD